MNLLIFWLDFGYVQHRHYRPALSILQSKSSEDLSHVIDRCSRRESSEPKIWLNELRSLNKFCPCVDKEGLQSIECWLSNSSGLTEKMKRHLILPSRSALTRLIVLHYHGDNFHVSVQHALLNIGKDFGLLMGMRLLSTTVISVVNVFYIKLSLYGS